MTLSSGVKLGPYEVTSPLGAGGMGEVYRARDTRLDRDVAIKVLPAQLSSNPDLKQRFEREARAISSLNHPHICSLYDVGSQDGVDFLVMELLEGETLSVRLGRGPLSLKDLLKTGIEIADALEKAHKQGIIHRDLKPGNIMLTKSGAKLMDFGLAKAAELPRPTVALSGTALTLTSPVSPITQAGTVVGTFQYMSPEQIEGKDADTRSDLFALGCVLYEMATAKRAFEGKSHLSVASAILEKEPAPISQSQPMTPPGLEHVVQSCMAKDPDERYQTAHDVKVELQWISASGSQAAAPAAHARGWKKQAWIGGALLLGVVLGAGIYRGFAGSSGTSLHVHATIQPPPGGAFVLLGDVGSQPAVSPDGSWIACAGLAGGRQMIYLRGLGDPNVKPINGTDSGTFPFWSPDSKSIGFFAGGQLKRVDLDTGLVLPIATSATARGGSWGSGGTIIFAPDFRSEIYSVPASGGTPRKVTTFDVKLHTSHRWPQFLPDGRHFLYLAISHSSPTGDANAVFVGSLDGKTNKRVMSSSNSVAYADGRLLFVSDGKLFAQNMDPGSFELSGEATKLADEVMTDPTTWRSIFGASAAGTLVLGAGVQSRGTEAVWYDKSGKRVGALPEKRNFQGILVSKDGRRVAAQIDDGLNDIWVGEASNGVLARLTFTNGSSNLNPVLNRDGSQVVYSTDQGKLQKLVLVRRSTNGVGQEEVIYQEGQSVYASDWSADDRYLLFVRGNAGEKQSLQILSLSGDHAVAPVVVSDISSYDGAFSPDMKWIAYASPIKGRDEVYVVPFSPPGRKAGATGQWQVSVNGGYNVKWGRDGKELFYISSDNKFMAVSIDTSGGTFHASPPRELFNSYAIAGATPNPYGVSPDGRFLVNVQDVRIESPLRLIIDWRRMATKP